MKWWKLKLFIGSVPTANAGIMILLMCQWLECHVPAGQHLQSVCLSVCLENPVASVTEPQRCWFTLYLCWVEANGKLIGAWCSSLCCTEENLPSGKGFRFLGVRTGLEGAISAAAGASEAFSLRCCRRRFFSSFTHGIIKLKEFKPSLCSLGQLCKGLSHVLKKANPQEGLNSAFL